MKLHHVPDNLIQSRPPLENALRPLVAQILVVLLSEVIRDQVQVSVPLAAPDRCLSHVADLRVDEIYLHPRPGPVRRVPPPGLVQDGAEGHVLARYYALLQQRGGVAYGVREGVFPADGAVVEEGGGPRRQKLVRRDPGRQGAQLADVYELLYRRELAREEVDQLARDAAPERRAETEERRGAVRGREAADDPLKGAASLEFDGRVGREVGEVPDHPEDHGVDARTGEQVKVGAGGERRQGVGAGGRDEGYSGRGGEVELARGGIRFEDAEVRGDDFGVVLYVVVSGKAFDVERFGIGRRASGRTFPVEGLVTLFAGEGDRGGGVVAGVGAEDDDLIVFPLQDLLMDFYLQVAAEGVAHCVGRGRDVLSRVESMFEGTG